VQGTGAAGGPWSASAVRDTLAAIARQPAYRRVLTTTLGERVLDWLLRLWLRVFAPVVERLDLTSVGVVLIAFVLALAVARAVAVRRAADREAVAGRAGRPGAAAAGDPWLDAERLAAGGEYTPAARALYAALLSRLAGRGDLRLHPSKTAGDYARELRRRASPAHAGFQSFRLRYDRVIYGAGACTASDYAALLHDAGPVLERAA
jgi:Domain of unknown function (DUF4129)